VKFRIDKYTIAVFLAILSVSNFAGAVSNQKVTYDDQKLKSAPQDVKGEQNRIPDLILVDYLTEGFESWFPAGWTSDTSNANYTWYQTLGNVHDGSAAAELYNDPAMIFQDEWLISPTLDFSSSGADLSLSFWFMTSYYWHVNPFDNADLEVLISIDNGATWSPPLWTEDDYGVFTNWTWYQQTLGLSAYVGQSSVKIAFRYIGVDGAQLTIDEIQVADSSQGPTHDVGPLVFVSPGGAGPAGVPITPQITFRNFGTSTESFGVSFTITFSGSGVYTETDSIAGLAPGASSTISFPSYIPESEGIYALTAVTVLGSDQNPANNELRSEYNAMLAGGVLYDFENGDQGFASDGDWQHGVPTTGPGNAHSGVNVFGTLINGQYSVGPLLSSLISPAIQVGTGTVLSFWHWYGIEESYDGGNVKVSTDGGAIWNLITPAGGYDFPLSTEYGNPIGGEMAFTGSGMAWSQETFDLSIYDGEPVMIRFDFGSDNAVVIGAGWYIDDIALEFLTSDLPGTITGTVLQNDGTSPIMGAIVSTFDGQNQVSGIDTTDVMGGYSFTVPAGVYRETFSKPGYRDTSLSGIVVTPGGNTSVLMLMHLTGAGCSYVVGDVNNSGVLNGIDVTYGVGYFKGGNVPPYSCDCNGSTWYVTGDVNGNCQFNGIDITYMVSFFKGGALPIPCPACQPIQ
jgi:hypothetical protein